MDSREAKAILACYRPGVDDPSGEPLASALEQARRDPELESWLARETALDGAIAAKLRASMVPENLRARILAGRPAPSAPAWWRRPLVVLAPLAVAAVATVAILVLYGRPASGGFAGYRAEMVALVSGDYKLDVESGDLKRLEEFFAARGWPADYAVPATLRDYPLEGGMAVTWRGEKVSVVCFGAEDDEDKDLWLFVIEASALPDAPSTTVPVLAPVAKLTTASWRSGDKTYLLVGRGDEGSLRAFL